MAKDPAFLFYYQDFLVGTDDLNLNELGAFIRCLCHQASKGGLTKSHMRKICESHEIEAVVIKKFKPGENDLFFNERLRAEMEKRKAYTDSRKANRSKPNNSKSHMRNISDTYVSHMENEDVNENKDEERKKKVKKEKPPIVLQFPFSGDEFMNAWYVLITQPKWKRKSPEALQAALKILSEVSEPDAVKAIEATIAGGWQGIFPEKSKIQYGKQQFGDSRQAQERTNQMAAEILNNINRKYSSPAGADSSASEG